MNTVIIGGAIVAIVFLALGALLRRWSLGNLATQVAELRRLAGLPLVYRQPTNGDPFPPLAPLAELTATLKGAGFEILGDFTEMQPNGKVNGVTRWFRNADGDIVGWCGIAGTPPTVPVIALMSETATGQFIGTLCGPQIPHVVIPPFFHPARVPFEEGITVALEKHQASLLAHGGAPLTCTSAAEAQALMNRRLERSRDWRAAQPADQLRADDVRQILGTEHAQLMERLLTRVRAIEAAA